MTIATTTAETIRVAWAGQIQTIVPRFEADRAARWTWKRDEEIVGELRNFDLVFGIERDSPLRWHGGGIAAVSLVKIVVSYPVAEPRMRRLAGSDWLDLASQLAQLHESISGMFPWSMQVEAFGAEPEVTGSPGQYVVTWSVEIHFFAPDTVTTQAVS